MTRLTPRIPRGSDTALVARVSEPSTVTVSESLLAELGPTSVRVDVILNGICGSDVKMFRGGETLRPSVFGHEWVGRVTGVGSGVSSVAPGDRVVVSVPAPCGECASCVRDHGQFCRLVTSVVGGRDAMAPEGGGFATSVTVAEYRVLLAHAALSDIQAALLEPTAVALRGVRASRVELGDRVVVQGGGPIGLLALQLAKAAGAGACIVIEPSATRRSLALSLGADLAVSPAESTGAVRDLSDGLGADVVFECSGRGELIQRAVELARRGGTMGLLGFALGPARIQPATWVGSEIKIVATAGYSRSEQVQAMELMAREQIQVGQLYSRSVALEGLQEILTIMAAGESEDIKVLVDPFAAV